MGHKGYIVMYQGCGRSFVGGTDFLRRRIGVMIGFLIVITLSNCGRQRGARNPKPRLLLHMRRMYVVSIRLDFHLEWMECKEHNLITCI